MVRRTLPDILTAGPDGTVVQRQRYVGIFSQALRLEDFPLGSHVFRFHLACPGYFVFKMLVPLSLIILMSWLVFLALCQVIVTARLAQTDRLPTAHRMDRWSRVLLLVLLGALVAGWLVF